MCVSRICIAYSELSVNYARATMLLLRILSSLSKCWYTVNYFTTVLDTPLPPPPPHFWILYMLEDEKRPQRLGLNATLLITPDPPSPLLHLENPDNVTELEVNNNNILY